jgi:hypothetical protein
MTISKEELFNQELIVLSLRYDFDTSAEDYIKQVSKLVKMAKQFGIENSEVKKK